MNPPGIKKFEGLGLHPLTGKFVDILEALLWAFHNAKTGVCFPSYETIAEAAHCARSTVAEAIKVLEDAGPLRAPEPGQKPDTSEGRDENAAAEPTKVRRRRGLRPDCGPSRQPRLE